eukprot:TRINITY_DN11746_c0_g1_i2.p1 TRINITY_DN11746_c0_g1~~TRINITY_DN11746_c0_g1_i2.p1  ORF type:complete len:508 (-),score=90.66 TRINITY_DN11746_c0_g1_i2:1481-3004(-)
MAVGDCNQVEEENQKMEGWGCWVIVPPFECKWLLEEDLTFREAGKGCVVFEAFADNDVTVVFREEAGSKHCHYRRDYRPDYAVVLGSHRNRRLRIEAGGESVADVVGPKLCSSDGFQSFWISICDGMISVGKGTEPGVGVVLQWRDSQPRCKVRYVGLSSWDKHVGYRNVRVLSLPPACKPRNLADTEELRGLEGFLERWELADVRILVGSEGRVVPAHRIVLALCCNDLAVEDETIRLPSVDYQILHALLQFMYTGRTQVSVPQLEPLCELSEEFGVESLVLQCEQMKEALKDKFAGEDQKVELLHSNPVTFSRNHPSLSSDLPVNVQRLKSLLETGDYSDVKIYIEGHGLVAEAHKLVLSAWSTPFAKMFTNGMSESTGSEIHLRDILPEAFLLMLQFMYSGELGMDETQDLGPLLLPLLLLADQFGISMLQQECCEYLLECLSEDSVCPILQVISFTPACRSLEEACETYFAQHFDYCTTSSRGFTMLEKASFMRILQACCSQH